MTLERSLSRRARREAELAAQAGPKPADVPAGAISAGVPNVEPEHNAHYWAQRRIILDGRGQLEIDPASHWGFDIHVITASHLIDNWTGAWVGKRVSVGPHAWICSDVVLYNCIIGEGAVVAAGSVVRSCEVKPWTMVAGNPARVIARCPGRAPGAPWVYEADKWTVLE